MISNLGRIVDVLVFSCYYSFWCQVGYDDNEKTFSQYLTSDFRALERGNHIYCAE